jgi:hypothetical protein
MPSGWQIDFGFIWVVPTEQKDFIHNFLQSDSPDGAIEIISNYLYAIGTTAL